MIDDALRIKVIRVLVGMTSQQFAERLQVSVGTLTAWEKGRALPQPEKRRELGRLCQEGGIAFLPSGMPVPAKDTLLFKETKSA